MSVQSQIFKVPPASLCFKQPYYFRYFYRSVVLHKLNLGFSCSVQVELECFYLGKVYMGGGAAGIFWMNLQNALA